MGNACWRLAACLLAGLYLVPIAVAAADAELTRDRCPAQKNPLSAARIQCGWVDTGERLGGEPVRLRVAVLRAHPDIDDPRPVIYVPGGPGDAAGLDAASLRGWRAWQQRAGWRHDIVLFDPRGTGESRPRPRCNALRAARQAAAATASTSRFESARQAQAAAGCYHTLGPDQAAALGPEAQLRDLEHLLDALDVARAQIWGVSYGTRLARLFAARYPARVAALVLDSMIAFERGEPVTMPARIGGAIAQLDAACRRPLSACEPARPAPSHSVARLLEDYQRDPPKIAATGARDKVPPTFMVTPYRLLLMIVLASYQRGNATDTVARLRRAAAGQASALAPLAARLWRRVVDDRRNEAVSWSTRCAFADGVPAAQAWQHALSAYPAIAPYLAGAHAYLVCNAWPVPRVATPSPDWPLAAPTLVLAGEADPITPSDGSRRFVRSHPAVRSTTVAGGGHAVTLDNACAQRAVARFLDNPGRADLPDCQTAVGRSAR